MLAGDLQIDGSGKALVQNGILQAPGLEEGADLRHIRLEPLANAIHVFVAAGLMVLRQGHLDRGGVGSGVGGIDGSEIGNHAKIGNDQFQVSGPDDLADDVFNLGHQLFGDLDARSRGRLQVDDELAGVAAGKEGDAEQGKDKQAQEEDSHDRADHQPGSEQGSVHVGLIPVQHLMEFLIEGRVEAGAPRARAAAVARGSSAFPQPCAAVCPAPCGAPLMSLAQNKGTTVMAMK